MSEEEKKVTEEEKKAEEATPAAEAPEAAAPAEAEKAPEAAEPAEASVEEAPAEPAKEPETGKVKWFSNLKGFGFLQKEGDEKDIFVHYSFVQGEGYKKLKAGDEVTFEIEDTGKGPQARNVIRTKKAEKPDEKK